MLIIFGPASRETMSTLLQLRDLHKSYGDRVIFDGASGVFAAGDRVGLIGRNGAGKTTLCRLLLGDEELDGGEIARNSSLRLGYLEQGDPFRDGETALEYLERETGREAWRCAKVAGRFQLGNDILAQEARELPGGFQTRLRLAAMLLREPNFLVLDEPTNYLDLRTLLLLERFLRDFRGGYIIVSHDREFLERTCDVTVEAERGQLTFFPGDVESYLAYKRERREQEERYNRNVEAKQRHLQNFVDRNRVRASTASRAQSKLKQIARLKKIDVEGDASTARIKIPSLPEKRGTALRCEDLAIGYPDREVASDIHFEIERGEHVAVLGDNGQGKTTFLRTITGELAPRGGSYRWGHGLTSAYYAQHVYTEIESDLDVASYLRSQAHADVTDQDVLDMAGSFLFSGDDAAKSISVLSGGERARVCLAALLLKRQPVLLLDEPTNHLDFETVEALGRALSAYPGTIFFISHDRTFVNLVATQVVEVKDGRVTLFPGDYEMYVYQAEREIDGEASTATGSDRAAKPKARGETGAPEAQRQRRQRRARRRQLVKEIARAEEATRELEVERRTLSQHFIDNPLDPAPQKTARLAAVQSEIQASETRWLQLNEELEALGKDD